MYHISSSRWRADEAGGAAKWPRNVTKADTLNFYNFKCNLMVIYANEIHVMWIQFRFSVWKGTHKITTHKQSKYTRRMLKVDRYMPNNRVKLGKREKERANIYQYHELRNVQPRAWQLERNFIHSAEFFFCSQICNWKNAVCVQSKIG